MAPISPYIAHQKAKPMSGSRLFTSAKHDASGEHTAPVVLAEPAPSLAQQLRLFFKYGRTDTATGVYQPEQLLQRVRLLFLCFLGVTLVPHLLAPIVGNQQHNSVHIAASGAILVLLWWWLRGYRRQHLPVLSCVVEAAGLLLVLAATNQPSATAGIVYVALYHRALYVPGRYILVPWLSYLGAYLGATALVDTLANPLVREHVIGLALNAIVVAELVKVLHKHDDVLAREHVLRQTGTALATHPERDAIHRTTLNAVARLLPTVRSGRIALLLGVPEQMRVVAVTDGDGAHVVGVELDLRAAASVLLGHAPQEINIEALAPQLRSVLHCAPTITTALVVPLRLQGVNTGALVMVSHQRWTPNIKTTLADIAMQAAVALERVLLMEDLQRREARFRSLVQHASDIIMVLSTDGVIQYFSPAAQRIMGLTPDVYVGSSVFTLVHPDDLEHVNQIWSVCSLTPNIGPLLEMRCRHADGTWRYLEAITNNLSHEPGIGGIVVTARDITERKMLEMQLTHQAFHDALTNLPNRALFMDRLQHALARAARQHQVVAVLFLDLDRFKIINDSLGHDVGDQLLQAVSARLRACVRPADTVARLGGDEFTLLLEDVDHVNVAVEAAERIAAVLAEPFTLGTHDVCVSTSVGIALSATAASTPDALLRCADMAMYEAKHSGKARYAVFEANLNTRTWQRLQMEIDLRRAITNNELRVYYQPLVHLETGRIVEVEALVRWQHPERGVIAPQEFIPLAEETGLILPLGQWVLDEACAQMGRWQAQHSGAKPLMLSVNLSVRQFQHAGLVDDIVTTLERTGFDPHLLKLEITESVAMADVASTTTTLHALKHLGIQLAVDDFGTGYSAMSYLRHFPVDTLKIDQTFIRGLSNQAADLGIVQAVIAFAKTLKLDVTAEGIETVEQLNHLRALRCERGQGYYFAKPLPGDEFGELLANEYLEHPSVIT